MRSSICFVLCTLLLIQSVCSIFVCNDGSKPQEKQGICLRRIDTKLDPKNKDLPSLDKKDDRRDIGISRPLDLLQIADRQCPGNARGLLPKRTSIPSVTLGTRNGMGRKNKTNLEHAALTLHLVHNSCSVLSSIAFTFLRFHQKRFYGPTSAGKICGEALLSFKNLEQDSIPACKAIFDSLSVNKPFFFQRRTNLRTRCGTRVPPLISEHFPCPFDDRPSEIASFNNHTVSGRLSISYLEHREVPSLHRLERV
ncbi:hypothetical protein MJO28_013289 [Puccinia striiformis f. sp. tritici]|uniref:Uncharacterized protein n=1 Tax=Puccinia striiformis f. sp. tritici TaxID=168172 RepID=A0ACC0DY66_9BASI|nr:hypothetical protein MJO28_013289 [Puccinia striiformis f. sp. tritici]